MADGQPHPKPDKGKSREAVSDGSNSGPSESMASKVVNSAAVLARDLVFSNADSGSTLQQATSAGKTSTSGTRGTTSTHASGQTNGPSTEYSTQAGPAQAAESFRTPIAQPVLQNEEFDQFASLRGTSLLQETRSSSRSSWSQEFRQSRAVLPTDFRAAHQLPDDGAEVALLLSDPTFHAYEVDEGFSQPEDPSEATMNDLFGTAFNTEQQQAAASMRAQLPPAPVHGVVLPHNPLNLVPQFDNLNLGTSFDPDMQLFGPQQSSMTQAEPATDGDETAPSERQRFLTDWSDVLNAYTDEVWGDLLPVIRAAREQLEELTGTESTDFEKKVVPRLRMILGHLNQTEFLDKEFRSLGQGQEREGAQTGASEQVRGSPVYKSREVVKQEDGEMVVGKEEGHGQDRYNWWPGK
ncbi:hypothetical protein P152DRAFT_301219 [Eremomyces bilateralis CBS 781.70]|uniref:Uncharacterized protein n=1 Tax=Eremomyces bilateralis CBS 781.70 TaxID=1392243 RepID=A0A6G1G7H3_9PEZI|nr:uncharacterized protein P152DRAFT_301219 [Eremomyces bilateralis CBS 781.70]KAF1814008.1 hypothetical protein P152DRAFT_301219 [Eremomyces bilateralis CBS 781.70]